jgi:hypothetical protein
MSDLILPAHVASAIAYEQARKEFTAASEALAIRNAAAWMEEVDRALRRVDRELQLIYWPYDRPDFPYRGGYYYIFRNNDSRGAPPTWIEIHDGDGNPAEPTVSAVLEIVARSNLWDPRVTRWRVAEQRRALARDEAARQRADEERREFLYDRVNSATRVSIGFSDIGSGWAQNEDGRRRTKRKDRRP